MRNLLPVAAALMASACATSGPDRIATKYAIDPDNMMSPSFAVSEDVYRIGPADKLQLTVFQVPALSFEEIVVDSSGRLQLPLLGAVEAAGLTPAELSEDLQRQFGERFLRNPQVAVTVKEAASQKITVDGSVTKPGVFEMRGRTTLVQAIASAEGASRVANTRQVVVFRTVEGRRQVAVFDLAAIRDGDVDDPVLQGDDVVVVDSSRLSAAWRDIIAALPAFSTFLYLN